jgi:hypothetical protein
MKYICKKSSNQEMFAISLSSCSRYNEILNLTNQCSLSRLSAIFLRSVRMTTHPTLKHRWSPTPAIFDELQISLMLSFSIGVNSRTELVTSPRAYARKGAPRGWLGCDERGRVYCCIYSVREICRKSMTKLYAFADVKNVCS